MGALTESMTRLRDEILVLRHNRQTFRTELERSTKAAQLRVSAFRRSIASDLAGARLAWLGSASGSGQTPRTSHGVLRVSMEQHHETRIPPPLPEPAPFHGKALFKKHRKH